MMFSLAWAAKKLQARVVGTSTGNGTDDVTNVCIDSRQVTPGALFFALQGEQADGHQYVAQALQKGAVAAIVSREVEGVNGVQLVVPDTLRALGDLAMHYRLQFDIPVIGITGSVGKTSTKEMTAAVLRTTYHTLANEKNYNNEIGVPLTLFQLNRTHQAAVVEMGMRGLRQIDRLAEIARPTIGVITNIGHAHIELLGSQEKIAEAKSELLARLPENGIAIVRQWQAQWPTVERSIPANVRLIEFTDTVIGTRPDVSVSHRNTRIHQNGTVSFRVRVGRPMMHGLPVHLQAVGTHHVSNALAALAVAYALNIPTERAIAALEAWTGAEGRMTIRHLADSITVLDDCYNASPESMRSALETLAKIAPGGVAVLGDMRELGMYAEQAHQGVGKQIYYTNIRLLVTVGELARGIADYIEHLFGNTQPPEIAIVRYTDSQEAAAHIKELVRSGDTVLVKGSRAMGMEIIVDALTGETGRDAHA